MPLKQIFSVLTTVLLLTLIAALPRTAHADYYKYTDGSGTVCITNNRDTVPPKYRATMKVIREETLGKKEPVKRLETPGETPVTPGASVSSPEKDVASAEEPTSAFGRLMSRYPWFKPVLIVISIILLYLIVRKIAAALPSPLLARLVCIVFFLGVFVFMYVSYTRFLTSSFISVKTKMLAMFEKSNRREATEPGDRPLPLAERAPTVR